MKQHGPWRIKSTAEVYRDPFVALQLDQVVRPDGNDGQHVVVHIKAGVCVLPIDVNNCVHLTKEFHYAVGRDSVEGVSGGIEPGETALVTAQRELQEELGLAAKHWEAVTEIDPFTTIMRSPTQLYIATELTSVPASPEGTEQIEHVKMALSEAVQAVKDGQITHAPTCIVILLAALRLSPTS